jgi:hypothetical protein
MFMAALFTIAKLWKQSRCPIIKEWTMKLWYIYTMGYYSTTRNNDMGFEGKLVRLEDIMLSEVSQDQKHKRHIFPLMGNIAPKTNIYTKTSMIIHKLRERGRGKENDRASVISHILKCEGRGYKNVY